MRTLCKLTLLALVTSLGVGDALAMKLVPTQGKGRKFTAKCLPRGPDAILEIRNLALREVKSRTLRPGDGVRPESPNEGLSVRIEAGNLVKIVKKTSQMADRQQGITNQKLAVYEYLYPVVDTTAKFKLDSEGRLLSIATKKTSSHKKNRFDEHRDHRYAQTETSRASIRWSGGQPSVRVDGSSNGQRNAVKLNTAEDAHNLHRKLGLEQFGVPSSHLAALLGFENVRTDPHLMPEFTEARIPTAEPRIRAAAAGL